MAMFVPKQIPVEAWRWDETLATLSAMQAKGLHVACHYSHVDRPGWVGQLGVIPDSDWPSTTNTDVPPGAWLVREDGGWRVLDHETFVSLYDPATEV
jgi:hypothetical protein